MGLPANLDRINIVAKDQEAVLHHVERFRPGDIVQITSLQYERRYRQGDVFFMDMYDRIRQPGGGFEQLARFDTHFVNKNLYMKLDPMYGGYFVGPNIEFYRCRPVEDKPDKGNTKS